jgi:uncharacterized membrane protein
MASELVVLTFEGEQTAEGMLDNLKEMQERGLLHLEDAVLVSRGQSTEVRVQQTDSRRGRYALTGGGIGLLAGWLVGGPIGGAAVGAVIGALRDRGIDDGFIRDVSKALQPDSSGIFLLVRDADDPRVLDELKPFKAVVVHTTLPPEAEQALRETLAQEQ